MKSVEINSLKHYNKMVDINNGDYHSMSYAREFKRKIKIFARNNVKDKYWWDTLIYQDKSNIVNNFLYYKVYDENVTKKEYPGSVSERRNSVIEKLLK